MSGTSLKVQRRDVVTMEGSRREGWSEDLRRVRRGGNEEVFFFSGCGSSDPGTT